MSDLAVKCFMASNGLVDFEVAQNIMYKYGLAQDYEDFADKLQFLLTDEVEDDGGSAFIEGAEFIQDVFSGLKFKVPSGAMGSEFVHGINHAMRAAHDIIDAAVDGARFSVNEELQQRVQEASILPLDQAQIVSVMQSLFSEQASR